MSYVQNTPNNPHIINVNDNSKWDTSDSSEDFSLEQDNNLMIDSSVPGSWKINNGTTCWDHQVPIPAVENLRLDHPTVPTNYNQAVGPPAAAAAASSKIQPPSRARVEVQPHNPKWAKIFEAEAYALKSALYPEINTIYHIGSTSVVGLPSKAIIDMIPVVQNILNMDSPQNRSKLALLGYEYKGENGIPFRRFYTKNDSTGTCNVHVYQQGNPEIEHHLSFCNYLRSEAAIRSNDFTNYAQLKIELAKRYPNDMRSYSLGKSNFITKIISKLNFEGVLFRNCYTQEEWDGYNHLIRNERNAGSGSSIPIHRFVLLYHCQAVCAAYVCLDRDYFKIGDIQVDEQWRGHGFEGQMEQQLQHWNQHQQFLFKYQQQ